MQATHREVEHQPAAYGIFHLTFVALSLLVIVGICYALRKSSDKTFRAVMFSVGFVLLLSEIYKQLYYYFVIHGVGYDWYIFPFQLCSVPMYLAIAVGCMPKCSVRDALCEYMASIGLLGGLMAYIEPSGILNNTYFTIIHSCLWHALLIFMAGYIWVTGNACKRFTDYKKALLPLGGVVVTATALNVIFCAKPDFNMCYISPFYNTPLAVFSSFDGFFQGIWGQYGGRVVSIAIYILALVLGGAALYGVGCLVRNKK